ncbi:MAG: LysM peptidoglycan-binding domain-containing protein [bacterium]|nr:LysM peptidoglycan-binding domain-containing protein [bacterium]
MKKIIAVCSLLLLASMLSVVALTSPSSAFHDQIRIDPGTITTEPNTAPPIESEKIPAGTTVAPIMTIDEREFVVADIFHYTVRRGDTLERIARRFNVPMGVLLERDLNPVLAARHNPNLVLRGESLAVPLYKLVSKPESEIAAADPVIVPNIERIITEKRLATAEANAKNSKQAIRGWYKPITLGLLVLVVLLFVLVTVLARRPQKTLTSAVSAAPVSVNENTASEIMGHMQAASGFELEKLVDLQLTTDEVGNPVTIKKVKEFLAKRQYLRDYPVSQWEGAMRLRKEEGPVAPSPEVPPTA